MSHRISVTIDDDTWDLLRKIPPGEHGRVLGDALRERLNRARCRRQDARTELDALRRSSPQVSTEEVVRWVREGRERHDR